MASAAGRTRLSRSRKVITEEAGAHCWNLCGEISVLERRRRRIPSRSSIRIGFESGTICEDLDILEHGLPIRSRMLPRI